MALLVFYSVNEVTKSVLLRALCIAVSGLILVSCADVRQSEQLTESPSFNETKLPAVSTAPLVKVAETPDLEALRKREEQSRLHQVRMLLAYAEQAFADDRLMVPRPDNAFDWYQRVLDIDEANAEAHWGMLQITERYLTLAKQAFTSGRRAKAELMLSRAEQVAATPAQSEEIRKRYQKPLADNEFLLSAAELSNRSDTMKSLLYDLAKRAKEAESRMLIVARTDAEGRWIYQQMRQAITDYRLRGNIEIGLAPKVVLIDLGKNSRGESVATE